MYFDTHAHYDDSQFDPDREELLASLPALGVSYIINPGCTVQGSEAALALAERFEHVYAAAGIHPEEIETMQPGDLERIAALAKHEKCLAIGEVGLDYYWDSGTREGQKELFARQLELSLSLDLPVIVHDREAHADCLELVSSYSGLRGVFHCYSGSVEMARELVKRGWYLGFDGPITYKNARKALEVLDYCPIERILIETDSPYLAPVPRRGKRNDSSNLPHIVDKIAEIKALSHEAVARRCLENGRELFNIK